jgi:hypothetical protein
MSSNIKNTTQSAGWQEILDLFYAQMSDTQNTQNIKQTLSAEHIKLEVMSRAKAVKIVQRVLKQIDKIANAEELKPKVVYK